ncbi:MAG: F0F1 ATP synthase subunit alpha [Lachnospiraceae bacterium]|nr:F0F1 ATP synthase subunit alpha [Lachnospiraceae bacterium]
MVDEKKALLYSSIKPDATQEGKILTFLTSKYGENVTLDWVEDKSVTDGFRLEIGKEVYDWTRAGRLEQFKERIGKTVGKNKGDNIIPLIKETVKDWQPSGAPIEFGVVTSVGDGIATVSGLKDATYGEILLFSEGIRGMVLDLRENEIGCILFDDTDAIAEGSRVKRTGRSAGIPVGNDYLGRVINPLGLAIDGKGDIEAEGYRAIESPAPGIIDRQPVNRPMETGILCIDSMFPIGRGQRELIIGDRQTGKTAIALDTIVNQKGKDVICIYVSIGQKASLISQMVTNLKKHGAMDYTIIVNASASDAAPIQYIAPYSGCALAEFFMHQGKDVLIVYDDLSKHAIAYRSLSLLLDRSPGREAYPGDVFYLHSRLLERAAHLSDELSGGSITALPIVETQAGDVAAYIPTNIISITDGQIFLESELFFEGQRPAVNVGLSVSRVGGDAQTKAMKKASGSLRLDLAQYREMEVFTQFSSDLDDATQKQLTYGHGLMYILRQPQYKPYSQHEQVILLVAALAKYFMDVPVKQIAEETAKLLAHFETLHADICSKIESTGLLTDEDKKAIINIANEYKKNR